MKRSWGLLLALTVIWAGCNRVPLREVASNFKVQIQELRTQGEPVKVDILWVVDDSNSMSQEQVSLVENFRKFMDVLRKAGKIDPHIAVTTTNMCNKEIPGAVRGKFIYEPVTMLPASAREAIYKKCFDNSDCPEGWECSGHVAARDMYLCDDPSAPKHTDANKGLLYTINPKSTCIKPCDRQQDPLMCARMFGESGDCKELCKNGSCKTDECVALGLGTAEQCQRVCEVTNTCDAKCEMFFGQNSGCEKVCSAPPQECFKTCAGYLDRSDAKHPWHEGVFDKEDVACGIICKSNPTCDELCLAQFGGRTTRCIYAGGDKSMSGCIRFPDTRICPDRKDLFPKGTYPILTNELAEKWYEKWKNGEWVGKSSWVGLPKEVVVQRVFETLFQCMAMVGARQKNPCAGQEMGLRAAWAALDPNGENADQAKAFLRPDAYLLVIIVSDEDDCSANKTLGSLMNKCACLRDWNGCPSNPFGECDPAHPGPLIPVPKIVSNLKSLKKDPAMVLYAAITGEPIPKTDVTPTDDFQATVQRYYECKCAAGGYSKTSNYICKSRQGIADYGARYVMAAQCFGSEYGVVSNICNDKGLEDALTEIVRKFSPLFARICLPRPLHPEDELQVYRVKPDGSRVLAEFDPECTHKDKNHYRLIKNSPGCKGFDITAGERPENAIAFCQPLEPQDVVEINYQTLGVVAPVVDE